MTLADPEHDVAVQAGESGWMPLSATQEGLWFLQQLDPASTAYHLARAWYLHGPLDRHALENALGAVRAKQAVLRTRFTQHDGKPRQFVEPNDAWALPFDDLRRHAHEDRDAVLREHLVREATEPFELASGSCAARFRLLALGDDRHVLSVAWHHLISDGVSTAIFERELADAYRAAAQGATWSDAAEPTWRYTDFAAWQRERSAAPKAREDLAWWTRYVGVPEPGEDLPADCAGVGVARPFARTHAVSLGASTVAALDACCRAERCTPFVVLMAAWQAVLFRYGGRRDFCIGVPTSGRFHEGAERLMGLFVDTHVYRARVTPSMRASELRAQVRADARAALDHADVTLPALVDALGARRDAGRHPLFQTLFNVQRVAPHGGLQLDGVRVEAVDFENDAPKFDVSVDVRIGSGGIRCVFRHDASRYSARAIETLARRYETMLAAMCAQPERPLVALPFVDDSESMQLARWSGANGSYDNVEPVYRLIEKQTDANPQATALLFGERELSYAELDARANRLAHCLIAHGVGPDVLVGISVERSFEMVIGLLAIMKAGGAYVPLDPEYPAARLAYMMADSGIGLLLTHRAVRERLPLDGCDIDVLEIDALDLSGEPDVPDVPDIRPAVKISDESLAYVIYTSGSTGQPKGAGNTHGALFNRLAWAQSAYALTPSDTVLQKTPFSFDVSVWEFFWPLMAGARLAIAAPGDHREPAALVALIERHRVTTLHFVPAMLQAFVDHVVDHVEPRTDAAPGLRRILCSGEALPAVLADRTLRRFPEAGLYNLYGPTEAAIDVTHWTCRAGEKTVPIGRPIDHLTTHVLDASMNRVPPGVAGELYLGGAGLARGYHGRAALTAERFVPDPFEAGKRLYRTGDLARWRDDGVLDYLGRIDNQIKIRGLRIELGEIDAQLQRCDGVSEAVVVAREGAAGKRLVGYVVASSVGALDTARLAAQLRETLPEYMVPAAWMQLDLLPLSPNGKVDRRALPDPADAHRRYEVPLAGAETALARIWEATLRVERVGRHDNFFELGGDSILSLQIVERARQAGWKITARQLFEHQTIGELAGVAAPLDAQPSRAPVATADAPLLPMQAWFFEQSFAGRDHWNQAVLLESRDAFDVDALSYALRVLVRQHAVLHASFDEGDDGRWRQHAGSADDAADGLLWVRRARGRHEIESLCDEAQQSLDIRRGRLMRAVAIETDDGRWRLLLVIHHLVVDGVSWRFLLADLREAYERRVAGLEDAEPAPAESDRAWAARLTAHAVTTDVKSRHAERTYWEAVLAVSPRIPLDYPDGIATSAGLRQAFVRLDREETRRLLKDVPAAWRTQINDVLLTALGRALCNWTAEARIRIDLEGHGREALFDDVDPGRAVGWLTSLYPVALEPLGEPGDAVKRVKESLRRVPGRGIGFGMLKYMGDEADRRALASHAPSQVVFNYLGQLDQAFDRHTAWPLAAESAGRSQAADAHLPWALSVNGRVHDDALTLTLGYGSACYRAETIDRLAAMLRAELDTLIDHCTTGAGGATPSDFPLADLDQAALDGLPVALASVDDLYPLAPMQAGMLFHTLYQRGGRAYLNQWRADLDDLDVERFVAAWQRATGRHDVLRTAFVTHGAHWLQWVAKTVRVPVTLLDWRERVASDDGALDKLAQADLDRGFDIGTPPLQRLTLVRVGEHRHHLVWTHHHALMDGWSVAQLMSEVLRDYAGEKPSVRTGRYRDYLGWLGRVDAAASESWWRAQLSVLEAPVRIAGTLPAAAHTDTAHGRHVRELDRETTARIVEFARQQHVTVSTLVQAAWSILLSRLTGQRTVVFGATVAGRPAGLPGAQQIVGLFINTLPVVVRMPGDMRACDWLQTLQAASVASQEHAHTPLYDIQRWAGASGEGLFDNIVVFENYPVDDALRRALPGGFAMTNLCSRDETNYAFTLGVTLNETLRLTCRHARAALSDESAAMLAEWFVRLLTGFVGAAHRPLAELELCDDAMRARLLEWGRLRTDLAAVREAEPVHVRIARQAQLRPDAAAVVCGDVLLSYRELNERANRLAQRLIRHGVQPEAKVGVALERSAEMIVALLAILKAGAAYVPLDTAWPAERLSQVLRDSGVALLLTETRLEPQLPVPAGLALVDVDTPDLAEEPAVDPAVAVRGDNLAYVIYTSGSTGRPKGAQLTHANVARLLHSTGPWFDFGPDDVWTMFHSYAFDFSVWEIFGALCHGGKLVVVPYMTSRSPQEFLALLRRERVTVLNQTPSAFRQLMQVPELHACDDLALRTVIFGGEALEPRTLRAWIERFGDEKPRLINMYGITETTVHVTYRRITAADLDAHGSPVGEPIPDLGVCVLDAHGNLAPVGMAGELHVSGAGLARGYLDRAGLSAERFVPDPFGGKGGRLYRTGDLVRWRADGALDYLGRIDHQVKIRGFRIEPGEIEAQLLAQPDVREAIVFAQQGPGGARLVGYVTAQAGAVLDGSTLRARMSERLPDYMVPSVLMVLGSLPLTPNGKIDRKALPAPEYEAKSDETPAGEPEMQLAQIWCDVLQVTRVGRHDNFFELGGDSILCLKLVACASQAGLHVTPRQVFEHQTIATLAAAVQAADAGGTKEDAEEAGTGAIAAPPLVALPRDGGLPLSFAQQRLWFLWNLQRQSTAYHIAGGLRLTGTFDIEAARAAMDDVVAHQEALRTTFKADADGTPHQFIHAQLPCDWRFADLSARDDSEDAARAWAIRFTQEPFDLESGPLLRVAILKLGMFEHLLLVAMHHIVSDGWSVQVLIDQFATAYCAHIAGTGVVLPAPAVQYADYAVWQRRWLEAGELEREVAYWRAQLGTRQPVLALPTDRPRKVLADYRAARHRVELPSELASAVSGFARQRGTTPFVVLLAAFQAVLHRYTGQDDIRVGVPAANRERVEIQRVVGLFVNTQVLRAQIDPRTTLADLLDQTKARALGARMHEALPFDALVDALQPQRSLSHTPLFQVMFNHRKEDPDAMAKLPGLVAQHYGTGTGAAQFELTLNVLERNDGELALDFVYASELFDASSVARSARHTVAMLSALLRDSARAIADVGLLDHPEIDRLAVWERGDVTREEHRPVHGLIEAQSHATPAATALLYRDRALSYAQLNEAANRLAWRLIRLGVRPDMRVGVAMQRSIEMVVALLAILKAGGAYVPLDPDYPDERLAYMLDDSGVSLVLTHGPASARVPARDSLRVLDIDRLDLDAERSDDPQVPVSGENLAYVIYTSGSTGRPKGAANRHLALTNRLVWMQREYRLDATDTVLQKTPFSFDVSVWEFFWPLMTGARLAMAEPGDHRDPRRLAELIGAHRVTTLHFVPSMLQAFIAYEGARGCTSITRVVCSGEALPGDLAKRSFEVLPHAALHNLYGPTEAAIDVTHWRCDADDESVPIGRPIANLRTCVLDAQMNRVPPGVVGELYLGGVGLARGYLNRAGLSAERFVPDPFDPEGGRLYRTGDLARWRADGALEYLGRIDHQVKLRGFRIELGEIEAQLAAQAGVREAVVAAFNVQGSARLAAYLTAHVPAHAGETLDTLTLRARLAATLPDYMVPSAFVVLDALPLNANGKVDRKALPEPTFSSRDYEAPSGATETALARIWREVLGADRVGRHDNFFELGGDSILSLKVIAKAHQAGIGIETRQLFEAQTVAALARVAAPIVNEPMPVLPRSAEGAPTVFPASHAQRRQWFLWNLDRSSSAYHVGGALRLSGALDEAALRASFDGLVARHEALRTAFDEDGEANAIQLIRPHGACDYRFVDLEAEGAGGGAVERCVEQLANEPFDLRAGRLLRVGLIRLSAQEHVLVVAMHHIVSDGWSVDVLLREFVALYRARVEGRDASLPALPAQYADYAAWQRGWLDAGERERQLEYWRGELGDEHPVLALPVDHPRDARANYRVSTHGFALPAELGERVRQTARQRNATPFAVLLAAFATLLHRHSGQTDIRIGVPIANREHAHTQGMVGFFANTQVLRARVDRHTPLADLLEAMRRSALGAQAHQDLPFDVLVDALQPQRSLSHSPLFQVLFNHQRGDRGALETLPALTVARYGSTEDEAQFAQCAQFELVLNTSEASDGTFECSFRYAKELFAPETIARFAGHYRRIVDALAAHGERSVGDIALLDDTEQTRLLQWGRHDAVHGEPQPVHALIGRQARANPEATALLFGDEALSYGELDAHANRLAHWLMRAGVGPEVCVGIAVERSVEMVVGLLAILKAGGAYVPLDPSYPAERLAYMMSDSGVDLVLTQSGVGRALAVPAGVRTVELDTLDVSKELSHDPAVALHAENLAYVIYTSGSTGRPKGAANRHGALFNRLMWMQQAYGLDATDTVLQKTPFSFDVSVWEFFWPLITGARLALAGPGEHRDPQRLVQLISRHRVMTLHFVPSMLQAFLADGEAVQCGGVKRILCSGEALPAELQERVFSLLPEVALHNLYGPTEAAIDVTHWTCKRGTQGVPIGRPISNIRTHVLDAGMTLVPQGVAGELYLGGAGLARGYLKRPGLTAERFVPDPFDAHGGRLYRTGDLARWRTDGVLDYLGRIDHQIKIRGFRIELGEIEAQLLAQPGVREAVAVATPGPGGARLAAYVTAQPGQVLHTAPLRDALARALPDYMVPAALVVLDALPLNPNGKLDRNALPEPEYASTAYEAPQGEAETLLARVWSEVLGVARIGRHDNFFELGGDSILAMKVQRRVCAESNLDLELAALFAAPDLRELAQRMEQEHGRISGASARLAGDIQSLLAEFSR